MAEESKKPSSKTLVVDANVFIKHADVREFADEIYTTRDAIDEIKDEKAKLFLQTLPYELKIKAPSQKSLSFIVEFAKKTGDYVSLSKTDMKLLALAYDLITEKQENHLLRESPPEMKDFVPKEKSDRKSSAAEQKEEVELKEDVFVEKAMEDEKNDKVESEDDMGPEEGWITPDNLTAFMNQNADLAKKEVATASVSVMTTDYAMQNVSLQIGIPLKSFDGKLIRKVKTFMLECRGCYKMQKKNDAKFCELCGNASLGKVSVHISANGDITVFRNPKRKINNRGKIYSIPLAKGGKKHNDLILAPDEVMMRGKELKMKQEERNKNHIDFGGEDFYNSTTFENSRGSGYTFQVGYGRKNPNVVKKNPNKKHRK